MTQNEKWAKFRVIKKFTFFPLRIYQYTSQTTWWSWFKVTYIFQTKSHPSDDYKRSIKWDLYSYFYGHWWRNERMSWEDEYNDYNK